MFIILLVFMMSMVNGFTFSPIKMVPNYALSILASRPIPKIVTHSPTKNVTYDDLALKKCRDDNSFTIHGWWPEYQAGSWPQWCNKTEFKNFTESSISSIIGDMNKYWYHWLRTDSCLTVLR